MSQKVARKKGNKKSVLNIIYNTASKAITLEKMNILDIEDLVGVFDLT